ncbi:MAG: hypothetical protein ACTSPQ_16560 [Candidatus Helarchaeota archaeon]
MEKEPKICPTCGAPIIEVIFRSGNKVIKKIYICNCNKENSDQ